MESFSRWKTFKSCLVSPVILMIWWLIRLLFWSFLKHLNNWLNTVKWSRHSWSSERFRFSLTVECNFCWIYIHGFVRFGLKSADTDVNLSGISFCWWCKCLCGTCWGLKVILLTRSCIEIWQKAPIKTFSHPQSRCTFWVLNFTFRTNEEPDEGLYSCHLSIYAFHLFLLVIYWTYGLKSDN